MVVLQNLNSISPLLCACYFTPNPLNFTKCILSQEIDKIHWSNIQIVNKILWEIKEISANNGRDTTMLRADVDIELRTESFSKRWMMENLGARKYRHEIAWIWTYHNVRIIISSPSGKKTCFSARRYSCCIPNSFIF